MIKILTVPHTEFAARNMVEQLRKLGHKAAIFDKPRPGDESMYMIYQANHVVDMPKNYILQQTEIADSHWFLRPEYCNRIKRAIAVWDYSEENIKAYRHLNKNTCVVKPGVFQSFPDLMKGRDINYLFYGWIEGSERRRKILESLKEEIPGLVIVTDKLRDDMWSLLERTKIVFNIHYHDHSPLEAYRIGEAASFGCSVLTEAGNKTHQDPGIDCVYGFGGYRWFHARKPTLSTADLIDALRLAGIETDNEIEV